jgi:hypothetical protein
MDLDKRVAGKLMAGLVLITLAAGCASTSNGPRQLTPEDVKKIDRESYHAIAQIDQKLKYQEKQYSV